MLPSSRDSYVMAVLNFKSKRSRVSFPASERASLVGEATHHAVDPLARLGENKIVDLSLARPALEARSMVRLFAYCKD
jgi:hypothetical protein